MKFMNKKHLRTMYTTLSFLTPLHNAPALIKNNSSYKIKLLFWKTKNNVENAHYYLSMCIKFSMFIEEEQEV